MFFSGLPRLISLKPFPNLLKLVIVNQTIERIEGLETCVNLQELWITECKLKVCTYLIITSVFYCVCVFASNFLAKGTSQRRKRSIYIYMCFIHS